jgi:hypothetical protein
MRRKLLLVNVLLVALAIAGVWKFRAEHRRALERYKVLSPAPPPAVKKTPVEQPVAPPVQPGSYLDAAGKFLFSPDRNPTVVVEAPKVKPRPTLPQLFGVMNLGEGPIAIMAASAQGPHKTVHVGDTIGEFKLIAAAGDEITLEWDGQTIHAQVSDVLVKPSEVAPAGPAPAAAPASPVVNNSGRPGEYVIGPATQGQNGTIYQSPQNDTAPDGAVYQNKRKVVRQTPFGTQAWWEDVK